MHQESPSLVMLLLLMLQRHVESLFHVGFQFLYVQCLCICGICIWIFVIVLSITNQTIVPIEGHLSFYIPCCYVRGWPRNQPYWTSRFFCYTMGNGCGLPRYCPPSLVNTQHSRPCMVYVMIALLSNRVHNISCRALTNWWAVHMISPIIAPLLTCFGS